MSSLHFKHNYFLQHGGMQRVFTSPMNDYGNYVKTYTTGDGNILTEVNGPCFETETWTTEGGYSVSDVVKKWQTEIWTTTDAKSRIWTEAY